MLKLKFILALFFLFSNWNTFSQEITGIVYSENKIPLSDVNIKIRGQSKGTKSDQNGQFSLISKKGDLLVFSYVGMGTKKIRIKNFNPIKIFLRSKTNVLKEVEIKSANKKNKPKTIISRFREIEVDKVGYTAYSFSGEDIRSYSNIGIAEALVGRVPNFQITSEGVILRSRGFNNQLYALWEIDGIVFSGIPPYINPSTIENVFVVPSASATIGYGKRAGGGLIVVNTTRYKINYENKKQLKQLNFFSKENKSNLPNNEEGLNEIVNSSNNDLNKLKLAAYAYQKQGNAVFALRLYRLILSLDQRKTKSYRNVAESMKESGQLISAWDFYLNYLNIKEGEIDDISLKIIFNDMEHLYHAYELKNKIRENFITSKKPISNFKNQVRLIFEWTVPNETLRVEIVNPEEQRIKFQLGSSEQKDRFIEEVFIDGNLLGNWKLNVTTLGDKPLKGNLKVTIYRDWLSTQKILPLKRFFYFTEADQGSYKLLDIFF